MSLWSKREKLSLNFLGFVETDFVKDFSEQKEAASISAFLQSPRRSTDLKTMGFICNNKCGNYNKTYNQGSIERCKMNWASKRLTQLSKHHESEKENCFY